LRFLEFAVYTANNPLFAAASAEQPGTATVCRIGLGAYLFASSTVGVTATLGCSERHDLTGAQV
jgi:hypothetical protein